VVVGWGERGRGRGRGEEKEKVVRRLKGNKKKNASCFAIGVRVAKALSWSFWCFLAL